MSTVHRNRSYHSPVFGPQTTLLRAAGPAPSGRPKRGQNGPFERTTSIFRPKDNQHDPIRFHLRPFQILPQCILTV